MLRLPEIQRRPSAAVRRPATAVQVATAVAVAAMLLVGVLLQRAAPAAGDGSSSSCALAVDSTPATAISAYPLGPSLHVANDWSKLTTESPAPDGYANVDADHDVQATFQGTDPDGIPDRSIQEGADRLVITVLDPAQDVPVQVWDDGDSDHTTLNGPGFVLSAAEAAHTFTLNSSTPFIGSGYPLIFLFDHHSPDAGPDGVLGTNDDVQASGIGILAKFNGSDSEPPSIRVDRIGRSGDVAFDVWYVTAGVNTLKVRATSDVNPDGVNVKLVETGPDSARFEGRLCLIENKADSAPGALREGDTFPMAGNSISEYATLRVTAGQVGIEYGSPDTSTHSRNAAIDDTTPVVLGVTTSGGSGAGEGAEGPDSLTKREMFIKIQANDPISELGSSINVYYEVGGGYLEQSHQGQSAWYVADEGFPTGDRVIEVEATDVAGNIAPPTESATRIFRLDVELMEPVTVPSPFEVVSDARPTILIDFGGGGETATVTMVNNVTTIDGLDVQLLPDSDSGRIAFIVRPFVDLDTGLHELVIPAGGVIDAAGNTNEFDFNLTFEVDPSAAPTPVPTATATATPAASVTPAATATATPTPVPTVGVTPTSPASSGGSGGVPQPAASPTPSPKPPDRPTNVVATAGDAQATVRWSAPASDGGAPITGFLVLVLQSDRVVKTGPDVTVATVNGLVNGKSYEFAVIAINAVGEGIASEPSAAVVPTGPPGAPTNVVAKVDANGSIAVTWAQPSSNSGAPVTSYVVVAGQRETLASQTILANSTSALFNDIKPGVAVQFRVRAVNRAGSSPLSAPSSSVTVPAVVAVPATPNAKPTPGQPNAAADGTVVIRTFIVLGAQERSALGLALSNARGTGVTVPAGSLIITNQTDRLAVTLPISPVNSTGPFSGSLEIATNSLQISLKDGQGDMTLAPAEGVALEGSASLVISDRSLTFYLTDPVLTFRPAIATPAAVTSVEFRVGISALQDGTVLESDMLKGLPASMIAPDAVFVLADNASEGYQLTGRPDTVAIVTFVDVPPSLGQLPSTASATFTVDSEWLATQAAGNRTIGVLLWTTETDTTAVPADCFADIAGISRCRALLNDVTLGEAHLALVALTPLLAQAPDNGQADSPEAATPAVGVSSTPIATVAVAGTAVGNPPVTPSAVSSATPVRPTASGSFPEVPTPLIIDSTPDGIAVIAAEGNDLSGWAIIATGVAVAAGVAGSVAVFRIVTVRKPT